MKPCATGGLAAVARNHLDGISELWQPRVMAPALEPTAMWPLQELSIAHRDLELRYLDDALLFEIAALAAEGVHDDAAMPFRVPWTRGSPEEVARSVLSYQWAARARIRPELWNLELAVLAGGRVVGLQSIAAEDYPVTRSLETGSWLGRRFQRQGVGTRMRLLILHLAFDVLGADVARTAAFEDNAASLGVTRALGYRSDGADVVSRGGSAARELRFVLDRELWEQRPERHRLEVVVQGGAGALGQLGIAASPTR